MRRVHLRGRENILKRLMIHSGAANLSLVMRKLFGKGTPRGAQGSRSARLTAANALARLYFILKTLIAYVDEWALLIRPNAPPQKSRSLKNHCSTTGC